MSQPQLTPANSPQVPGCLSPHLVCCCWSHLGDNLSRDVVGEKCGDVSCDVSCDVKSADISESVTPNLSPAYIWPVDDL